MATTTNAEGQVFDWVTPESQLPPGTEMPKPPAPLWEQMGVEKSKIVTREAEAVGTMAEANRPVGPPGTVPIPRPDANHIAKYTDDYDEFTRMVPKPQSACQTLPAFGEVCRYYSNAPRSGSVRGTLGGINIWNPAVDEVNNAQPLSLMQFNASSDASGQIETFEAGWQVSPALYGDTDTHLFVFATRDGYGINSCYNLDCTVPFPPPWVQLSSTFMPGMTLPPSTSGTQNQIEAIFAIQEIDAVWYGVWFYNEWIGAVHRGFYHGIGLGGGIDQVDWYGEVGDDEKDGVATTTDMGSGQWASTGFGEAAYIRWMHVLPPSGGWVYLYYADPIFFPWAPAVTDSNCYTGTADSSLWTDPIWAAHMFVGGPGQNPNCMTDGW